MSTLRIGALLAGAALASATILTGATAGASPLAGSLGSSEESDFHRNGDPSRTPLAINVSNEGATGEGTPMLGMSIHNNTGQELTCITLVSSEEAMRAHQADPAVALDPASPDFNPSVEPAHGPGEHNGAWLPINPDSGLTEVETFGVKLECESADGTEYTAFGYQSDVLDSDWNGGTRSSGGSLSMGSLGL